ncbi:MAG: PKD domain-containing protein, partial [Candidatus Bipolaricaulota bacterium]
VTDADAGDTIASYKWNFGDGSTLETDAPTATATHKYNAPGDYTASVVAVDSRGGESAPKTLQIAVAGPERIVLYGFPNPAATQATFESLLPDGATEPVLTVYALDGRQVFEEELAPGGGGFVWNLRDTAGDLLGNGLYFCVVTARSATGGRIRSEVFRLLISR